MASRGCDAWRPLTIPRDCFGIDRWGMPQRTWAIVPCSPTGQVRQSKLTASSPEVLRTVDQLPRQKRPCIAPLSFKMRKPSHIRTNGKILRA